MTLLGSSLTAWLIGMVFKIFHMWQPFSLGGLNTVGYPVLSNKIFCEKNSFSNILVTQT
jgi:hypothetical protein